VNNTPSSDGTTGTVLALVLVLLTPLVSVANEGDPPGRVARVNLLEGSGAVQGAGAGAWFTDLLNRPLTIGDKLMIDSASRAELHVGSTAIRLAAQTSVEFLELGDRGERLGLSSGSVNLRVRVLGRDETVEIDTPSVAVRVLSPGEYRIDVDSAKQLVTVGVIDGAAEVTGRTQDYRLEAQQQGSFAGDLDLTVSFADLSAADSFDTWATLRDAHDDPLYAADRAPPEATGYEDLNEDYGTWQETVDFGPVWIPQVPAGWMPYQVGRWLWVDPWGWTWQDAAPWGFAPFHYGRWIAVGSTWAWSPGDLAVRPIYAPALVAWIDAHGSVAWVPLGAGEVYRPPYRASTAYAEALNAAATRNRAGGSVSNWKVPGAVAMQTARGFAAGRPITRRVAYPDTRGLKPASAPAAHAPPSGSAALGAAQAESSRSPAAKNAASQRDAGQSASKSGREPTKVRGIEPAEHPVQHAQQPRQTTPPKPDTH
jgi:hypothetical protein